MNTYTFSGNRKRARQQALLEAIAKEALGTQQDIVRSLRRNGIKATQVSVSRDIAELGLIKAGDRYQQGVASAAAAISIFNLIKSVQPAGPNLVVVRCERGAAARVGETLDELKFSEAVGTLAGDDTVFVATRSLSENERLTRAIRSRMPAGRE